MGYEIEATRVTKMFKKSFALRDASLTARRGISVIIGPNGAGKSTLLRCIGGLYFPESGSVKVFGRDPYHDDELRKKVSLLSDNYALYDKISVRKNLLFFGRLYGNSDSTTISISQNILRQLDAYQYIDKKAGELSRGTKQKIAIARALLGEPDAFLLDEPTAFLDSVSAEKVHIMLENFADEGKTILYATQRLNEATRFKADIFIIKKGMVSRKLKYSDLYGSVLKGAVVNIRLAGGIDVKEAGRVPHFRSLNGTNVKIVIRSYKDINESVQYLIRKRNYVVSVDYTEPLIEKMLAD